MTRTTPSVPAESYTVWTNWAPPSFCNKHRHTFKFMTIIIVNIELGHEYSTCWKCSDFILPVRDGHTILTIYGSFRQCYIHTPLFVGIVVLMYVQHLHCCKCLLVCVVWFHLMLMDTQQRSPQVIHTWSMTPISLHALQRLVPPKMVNSCQERES